MKVAPRQAKGFLAKPDETSAGVLIYGPDSGQVRERMRMVQKALNQESGDPFGSIELDDEQLKSDPALLADELGAISLMGGRRVVTVRDATDKSLKAIEQVADTLQADASYLIVCAGDLKPKSGLRKLFESHKKLAALACYKDEETDIAGLVRHTLDQAGVRADREAITYLVQQLGNDRMVTRGELEKIILYLGDDKQLTYEQASLLVANNRDVALEQIGLSMASGALFALETQLAQAFREGTSPVAIIRAALRHFHRLYQVREQLDSGTHLDEAMKVLRPPVFFRQVDAFKQHLRSWNTRQLIMAMERLNEAEQACKQTGINAELACHRALMGIAAMKAGSKAAAA